MFTFLLGLEVVISILLILAILMQSSKGGGLAGTFGGGSMGTVFGVRRTSDFLTKGTQVLAVAFGALALVINIFFLPRAGGGNSDSVLQGAAPQRSVTAPQLPPSQPAESPVSTPAPTQQQPAGK
jgi:preprotein translocase subunit SecG